MQTIQEASQWISLLIGIIAVAGALITVLAFALRRAKQRDENAATDRVLHLANEEMALLQRRAERVPELETQVKVLREEVGAAKAIAELASKTEAGFVSLSTAIAHHEERARRADSWQQARFEALVESQNALLANFHLPPVRVHSPSARERAG